MGIGNLLRSKIGLYVLAAAFTAAGAYLAQSYVSEAGRTAMVVVAARDIPPYTVLRLEDVALAPRPEALLPRRVFRNPGPLAGQLTRALVPAGAPLVPQYLAGEGQAGGGLAKTLRDAGRPGAFSLRLATDDAVAGRVDVGDRVDILTGYKGDDNRLVTDVLAGVLVLDVVRPDVQQGQQAGGGVTLVVEADEDLAQRLFTVRTHAGQMVLRLRPAIGPRGAERTEVTRR